MSSPILLDLSTVQPANCPRLHKNGAARFRADAHGNVVMRQPRTVTGVCIHQTACHFGPDAKPQQKHERAFDIPIHAVAFRDGTAVLPYPLLAYVWHGNGWNATSLGLEIEGHYCGRRDDPTTVGVREDIQSTWGGTPDVLDQLTLDTAKLALQTLVERARAAGCPIEYIWAHRQSAGDRQGDPGEDIWRELVLAWAVPVLGLKTQPTLALHSSSSGEGRPIPTCWDPAGVGKY